MGRSSRNLSPSARSFGALAAGVVVGLIVLVLTELLMAARFGPIRFVDEFDRRLFANLVSPPALAATDITPIVFIDIDDESISYAKERLGCSAAPSNATTTPRCLDAHIVRKTREAGASVVLLDLDLREPAQDDRQLNGELAVGKPPVLVPYFFPAGQAPKCDKEQRTERNALPTSLPLAVGGEAVVPVHVLFEQSFLGVESVCLQYRTTNTYPANSSEILRAAMLEAVERARCREAPSQSRFPCVQRESEVPIVWRLGEKDREFKTANGVLAFLRVPAWMLFSGAALDALRNAIVLVGSTHRGSGDQIGTPLGLIPGALVHANFGLTLQDGIAVFGAAWGQHIVDVLMLFFVPFLTTWLYWHPLFRRLRRGKQPTFLQLSLGVLWGFFITFVVWLLLVAAFHVAGRMLGNETLYRFGVLALVMSAVLVLLIEGSRIAADRAEHAMAHWAQRRLGTRPPTQVMWNRRKSEEPE